MFLRMSPEACAAFVRLCQAAAAAEQVRRAGAQAPPAPTSSTAPPGTVPAAVAIIPASPAMAIGVDDGVDYIDGPRGPGQVQREQPGWRLVGQAPRVSAQA